MKSAGIAAAIAIATFLLYIPSLSNQFLDFDDPFCVTENPVVQRGITVDGLGWAFTTNHFYNWLPVTWLSHMLDCQMWGLEPGGHHLTSVLIHCLNAALVYLLLFSATRTKAKSIIVAILFAVHPLRVESVAWIAERKDVLCALLFLLTLLAYVHYSRRPCLRRFLVVALFHALALMAKTMAVTTPVILLLFDYWPLQRWRTPTASADEKLPITPPASPRRLILEKVPLLMLSIIASAWTVGLQGQGSGGGALSFGRGLTIGQRMGNAAVSIPRYLFKTFWPAELSAFYPHPGTWPAWEVVLSVLLIVVLTAGTMVVARRRPGVFVGWFWFIVMLLPVLGIVQAGMQSMADRYLYLPSIGLLVAIVWPIAEWVNRRPRTRPIAISLVAAVVLMLAVRTAFQQRYWANTFELFQHALAMDDRNYLAHSQLGIVYQSRGDDATAMRFFNRAIELKPDYPNPHHNLGRSLIRMKRVDEGIEQFRTALRLDPTLGKTHHLLGIVLFDRQEFGPAAEEFSAAARFEPDNADIHSRLGAALLMLSRNDTAAAEFQQALEINPDDRRAQLGLAAISAGGRSPSTHATSP